MGYKCRYNRTSTAVENWMQQQFLLLHQHIKHVWYKNYFHFSIIHTPRGTQFHGDQAYWIKPQKTTQFIVLSQRISPPVVYRKSFKYWSTLNHNSSCRAISWSFHSGKTSNFWTYVFNRTGAQLNINCSLTDNFIQNGWSFSTAKMRCLSFPARVCTPPRLESNFESATFSLLFSSRNWERFRETCVFLYLFSNLHSQLYEQLLLFLPKNNKSWIFSKKAKSVAQECRYDRRCVCMWEKGGKQQLFTTHGSV